jgi:GT2 family glycosyltransferase
MRLSSGAAQTDQDQQVPAVGVVILNWNGWRDTKNAVVSAQALTWPNTHIYVVDNGSTDGSEEKLRALVPGLLLIQSGSNRGWSGGNNLGIQAALLDGCKHVLLLNNDARIRPDALTLLVAAAENLNNAASVGALIIKSENPSLVEFAGADIDCRTEMPSPRFGHLSDIHLSPIPVPSATIKGCAMLLTAKGIAAAGMLTEDYFLNYDETDWCYRAKQTGLQNYLVTAAIVEHKGALSFGGTEGPLYRYFMTRNRLVFAGRHLGRRGRWYAWRGAFWDLRQPPGEGVTWLQSCATILLAVADYYRGRLGDCPPFVRAINRRVSSN